MREGISIFSINGNLFLKNKGIAIDTKMQVYVVTLVETGALIKKNGVEKYEMQNMQFDSTSFYRLKNNQKYSITTKKKNNNYNSHKERIYCKGVLLHAISLARCWPT